jgi:hypothetical protein
MVPNWGCMKQTATIGTKQAFYSVPELAEITSESTAVWRKRILFRRIGYTKCGKNVRVSSRELERWLEAHTVSSANLGSGTRA